MKSKMKLSGQLRSYLRWPLILSILMLVMNIGMYFVDVMAGMWFTLFFAVYVIAAAVLYYRQRPQVINELITFATEYGQVQKHLIQELALPYAVMEDVYKRQVPESEGISSEKLTQMLRELAAARHTDMHHLLVLRNGHVICECNFAPYRSGIWHATYSMCTVSYTHLDVYKRHEKRRMCMKTM